MDSQTRNSLRSIGALLDRGQYPYVYNGGIVKPGETAIASLLPGEDSDYVSQRPRRSETRTWQGATGRQGPAGQSRASGKTPSLLDSSLRALYEAELEKVQAAYPDTTIWHDADGLWLLTESTVLPGLGKKATFLIALPFSRVLMPRAWGFWTTPISWHWIGPRHTNFPDGSICAFDPSDQTWLPGDSITELLDIYTLWALRQEHLKVFGRWPGYQSILFAYERLEELRDDEHCGCNGSEGLYRDCCKSKDLSRAKIAVFLWFFRGMGGYVTRKPHKPIFDVFRTGCEPPPLLETLTQPNYQP